MPGEKFTTLRLAAVKVYREALVAIKHRIHVGNSRSLRRWEAVAVMGERVSSAPSTATKALQRKMVADLLSFSHNGS